MAEVTPPPNQKKRCLNGVVLSWQQVGIASGPVPAFIGGPEVLVNWYILADDFEAAVFLPGSRNVQISRWRRAQYAL